MKSITLNRVAALMAVALLSTAAHATHPSPPPPPPPPGPPVSTSGSQSGAVSGSTSSSGANATGKAEADASAKQGQGQGQGQKQGQASTMSDSSSSTYRSGFYVFPQLAFTPPLPMNECPMTRTKQTSTGILFGAFSRAESSSDGDRCFAVTLYNDFIANCQYESARRFKVQMAIDVFPKFVPPRNASDVRNEEALDLTATECAALKAPVLPPAPTESVKPTPPAPSASAAVLPVVLKKKTAKTCAPADRVLAPSSWQCKAKGT
jgi:hypothetical protein